MIPIAALSLAVVAVVLIACGGGDDDSGTANIETGDDESYVLAACEAQNEFLEEVLTAFFADQDMSDEEQLEALESPFKDLRKAIRDSRPPEDAVDYHRSLLTVMDELLDAIENGDISVLESLDFNPDEALLDSTRARLSAIVSETEACEGLTPFDGSD